MIDAAGTPSLANDVDDVGALAVAFTVLVEAHPDAAYLLDLDGRFLAVNDALCERVQSDRASLLGQTFDSTVAPIDLQFVRAKFGEAARGESVQYEASGVRPDGTVFLAQITNLPVKLGGRDRGRCRLRGRCL